MRFKVEEHDYQVKLRNSEKFLSEGLIVRLRVNLRGREVEYAEEAAKLLVRLANDLQDRGRREGEPKRAGRDYILEIHPFALKSEPNL